MIYAIPVNGPPVRFNAAAGNDPAAADVVVLRDILAELRAAPRTEFVRPGVSANTQLHVLCPSLVGVCDVDSAGQFAVEWDDDRLSDYDTALKRVMFAVAESAGMTEGELNKFLLNQRALPVLDPAGAPVTRVADAVENLLHVYQSEVVLKSQPVVKRSLTAGVVVGALFATVALMGLVGYIGQREGRGHVTG